MTETKRRSAEPLTLGFRKYISDGLLHRHGPSFSPKEGKLFLIHSLTWLSDEPLIGLANVALKQGNRNQTFESIEKVWAHFPGYENLDTGTLLTCYQVFLANADPRADQVLEESHRVLLERAALISDEYMRRCYLENIPENREILTLWQAAQEH